MSFRHLRTIVAVAEHGFFAAAAQVVSLMQSAVSQQMKTLEEQLGLELFDRNKHPPQLNTRGEALEYGMVGINTRFITTEVAPFGGVKSSGVGREGSRHGLDEYLEMKYMCIAGLD